MSSAWGASWGSAWGDAWGTLAGIVNSPAGDYYPAGRPRPGKISRLRHPAAADVMLQLRCGIRAEARLSISATTTVIGGAGLNSKALLCISAAAETTINTVVSSEADSRDVLLEMLLIAD